MTLDGLVDRLAERGLEIPDRSRALRYLRHIGYYRLSPYTIPFQGDRVDHVVRPGTTFDDVLDLYIFDRTLRLLVMDAIERVEVSVRAAITDHMSTRYDDPHWYTDPRRFRSGDRWAGLLSEIRKGMDRQLRSSPEPHGVHDVEGHPVALTYRSALEHYLLTYGTPELPPSWVMVESLTIGQLDGMYRNIRERSDRTAIARTLGLTAPILESWLRTYVRVRNICAHHGRLWNVGLGVYPMIPTGSSIRWLEHPGGLTAHSTKRLYPVLVSLQSVLDVISPHSSWAQRLQDLLAARPTMNLRGMGVPDAWATDPFWARHLSRSDPV